MKLPLPGQQRAGSTRTLLTGDDGVLVRRTVLPNGLRILSESLPATRTAAIGVWTQVGSVDETPSAAGASHFLEHLLFKGTGRRAAIDISQEIETVGGDINAFTTKEATCFHARVLADDLPGATDVLLDMVFNSTIPASEYTSEQRVVIEEIAMYEDDATDVAYQNLFRHLFCRSRLANPIIGSSRSIAEMPRSRVLRHYRSNYQPDRMVVTAVGAVNHQHLVKMVKRAVAGLSQPDAEPIAARAATKSGRPCRPTPGSIVVRPIEQAHVMVGFPGLARMDDRKWALAVLDTALGRGMSSRLFQEVREKRGLVYSVHSFRSAFTESGVFGVYAGTSPGQVDETLAVIADVLSDVAHNGLTVDEFERAKSQMRGSSMIESEDPGSRLTRLGYAELLSGNYVTLGEVLESMERVTLDDVNTIAAQVLRQQPSVSVVGPFDTTTSFEFSLTDAGPGVTIHVG